MSFNALGAQQYARDVGRMFVSGHAPNVGIVGWSVGGGHGQLVPMLGMGVDQVCNLTHCKPIYPRLLNAIFHYFELFSCIKCSLESV